MDKTKLSKAFRELRKQGYFAKKNYSCCSRCGWASLTDEESKKAVFYHQQDNDDLKDTGSCYLSWSGDGDVITKILKNNGVKVDWDGNNNSRIRVEL
jgi:hypothetical protein